MNKRALYFSKEVIPFTSEVFGDDAVTPVFHHVGVYAYRPDALADYPSWPVGLLEQLEGLEQLRFMENGAFTPLHRSSGKRTPVLGAEQSRRCPID